MSRAEDVFGSLRRQRDDNCVSDLAIDEFLAGELGDDGAAAFMKRVEQCEECSARLALRRQERERFEARPTPIWLGKRSRAWMGAVPVAVAAAVALLIVNREPPPEIRTKGGDYFGFVIVAPDGTPRGDETTSTARPGDQLQWQFRVRVDSFVAVLGKDSTGRASVYYPSSGTAAALGPGPATVLPQALELDDMPGEERLYGLVCSEPIELEPLRRALEQDDDLARLPQSCAMIRHSVLKAPR